MVEVHRVQIPTAQLGIKMTPECPICGYRSGLIKYRIMIERDRTRNLRTIRICDNIECRTSWIILDEKKHILSSCGIKSNLRYEELTGVKVA